MSIKLKIALVGAGYWSSNIIRNILKFDDVQLSYIIDNDLTKLQKIQKGLPNYTQLYTDYNLALADESINAILIATPVSTHFQIAKDSIKAQKHTYVQKPSTETVQQMIELADLVGKNNVKFMTAFTYCYNSVVERLVNTKKELGDLYYYDSTRINLGIIQRDVNVVHDLFSHDAAILRYLTDRLPEYISATGQSHNANNLIDVANISLGYKDGFIAHVHVNWISPVKNRTIILAGKEKMAVFDDCFNEKLKIYDTGFSPNGGVFDYRAGGVVIPKVSGEESIYRELKHFFDCIKENKTPLTNEFFSISVVKMIEMANKSIALNGSPVSCI